MNNKKLFLITQRLIQVVFALYPLILYFSLKALGLVWVSAILFFLLLIKLTLSNRLKATENNASDELGTLKKYASLALWFMLGTSALNILWKNEITLRLYPVLTSLSAFTVFVHSLIIKRPLIEFFAKTMKHFLNRNQISSFPIYLRDPEDSNYYYRLTLIWTSWLLINFLISVYTTFFCSFEAWALYNNFIFYFVSGSLFLAEVLYRKLTGGSPSRSRT